MTHEPASENYEWTFRRVMWATLITVAVGLSFWLIYRSRGVIFIIFTGIVIGTVIRPIVTWLNSRGISRVVGSVFIYLFILGLLVGFVLLLLPLIFEQSGRIAIMIPAYYQNLRNWMITNPDPVIVQLQEYLPVYLSIPMLTQQTGEQMVDSAGQDPNFIASIINIIFAIIVVPFLAYYWTLYGSRMSRSMLLLVPTSHRERIGELITAIEAKVGAYVTGQAILCLIIGMMAMIAYLLIGLPEALALALIAGLLEAIPLIGPILGAIPAAIVAISTDPTKLIWVIVATIVIQQLENTLLVPRIMRKAVGVNPFVTLLSLFAFSSLLGIPGAFMAIPIAAILQLLLNRFVFDPGSFEVGAPSGRDYASRLRYEVQHLARDLRKQGRSDHVDPDQKVRSLDRVVDEIEAITTDLDALLAQVQGNG